MEHKKFFAELLRVIPKQEGVKFENEGEKINVKMDDGREFIIRKSGGITFEGKIEFNDKLENLHDCIVNTVRNVKEYLQAMDTSPALIAQDLDMPYKKLAEFNGIVLGGVERGNGMGYEFTTWEYINNKQGLYHGHYYSDYNKAKEDFAVRSGLVEGNKIFNNQELCEIYRCVSDTLDGYYELTDDQHQMLEDIQDRIASCVPNLTELINQSTVSFQGLIRRKQRASLDTYEVTLGETARNFGQRGLATKKNSIPRNSKER